MEKLKSLWVLTVIIAVGALFLSSASAQHAHVHGEAQAAVIIEGQQVTISLISSMHDIVGFEHVPQSDAEKTLLTEAVSTLEARAGLFTFNMKAHCRFEASDIRVPSHDEASEGGHSKDLEASFMFQCSKPDRLKSLTFKLLEQFERLQQLEVIVIVGNRQLSYQLAGERDTIRFDRN